MKLIQNVKLLKRGNDLIMLITYLIMIFSHFFREIWDCATCLATVTPMLEILEAPTTSVAITDLLNGEKFCQDPSLAFTEEQIKQCQDYITQFIPIGKNKNMPLRNRNQFKI